MIIMPAFLESLQTLVGQSHVRTGDAAHAFHHDERNRFFNAPLAVVLPESTAQVAQVVQLCASQTPPIAIIAQGGNTGLVGGCAVLPDQASILLNLTRLNRIIHVDPANRTMTLEAGVTLEAAQQAAALHNLIFPLTLASQSAATIGGNLATNAGGTQVLRFGTMRDLCLGLEVVLASGETWNGLNTLRKNNTGYDLKHAFIGAEGTLGIITSAVLKLFPKPHQTQVALVATNTISDIVTCFDELQREFDAQLLAFEYISPAALAMVCTQFEWARPFADHTLHVALIDISTATHHAHLAESVANKLNDLLEQRRICDAVLAQSLSQSQQFWSLREKISAAQKRIGKNIKHDVSVPISAIAPFILNTVAALESAFSGIEPIVFGHIGDGNVHFNVSAGSAFASTEQLMANEPAINDIVYAQVAVFNGSISAEHGIGLLKRDLMPQVKSPVELNMMRQLKHAFDPQNILNPNKIFPTNE